MTRLSIVLLGVYALAGITLALAGYYTGQLKHREEVNAEDCLNYIGTSDPAECETLKPFFQP